MITTVTLNTAVDKLYELGSLQVGKVNRVRKCHATAGGKGLNVSRIIRLLGEKVTATGFLGGYSGRYVEELLENDDIPHDFIPIMGETRTCINIIDDSGQSTEFLEPGTPVSPEEFERFIGTYRKLLLSSDVIVLSGSIPAGCPVDIYEKLIRTAKENNRLVILDASGESLKQGIRACPTMIKPNKDEIKDLLGAGASPSESAAEAAGRLREKGIRMPVISLGKYGAVIACSEGIFYGTPPDVCVKNTVGCGDAMVGALAVGLARGYSVEKLLRLALAVSAASAMCIQTGYFDMSDLQQIMDKGKIERLA